MTVKPRTQGVDLEFLPATLEIQETPPSPVGRLVGWSIITMFALSIGWSIVGRLDIVAVAHGKIIPDGRVKVVQPFETGVVKRKLVREGETVEAGQLLLELDTTLATAEVARLENTLLSTRLEQSRVSALLAAIHAEDGNLVHPPPSGASPVQIQRQQFRLREALAEYHATLGSSRQIERRHQADLAVTRSHLGQLNATIPLIDEQTLSIKKLVESNLAPRMQWLDLERERIEQVEERERSKSRLLMTEASIESLKDERNIYIAKHHAALLGELTDLENRAATYVKELTKAKKREQLHYLTAPVSGVVNQLRAHTVGGVVTTAEPVMSIVPSNPTLVAEAWVQNKDIGFVHEGQLVSIKIDAFPFTRYGLINGEIIRVSEDAVHDEKLGWNYAAYISLERSSVRVGGKDIPLSPGMTLSAEVKVGKRRLIEFLLSPLIRGMKEAARER